MIPYDNIEVVRQHQVVVAWIRSRKIKKLREPKTNNNTPYLIKTLNCFDWDVSNKKIIIRDNGNSNDNGDSNNRSSNYSSYKDNTNDNVDHKSNDNNSNNNEKTSISLNNVNDYNSNGSYDNKSNNNN